jgi:hypothetical protein
MRLQAILRASIAVAALATGFVAAQGFAASPAEARRFSVGFSSGGYHHHHHRHYRSYGYVTPVFITSSVRSCSWLRVRAEETRRTYWVNRYENCMGW